jgi:hypothetical protein
METGQETTMESQAQDHIDKFLLGKLHDLSGDLANDKMTVTDFRELFTEIRDTVVAFVDDMERDYIDKLETADKAVRDAAGIIDLAIAHHDDAERFGWSDRDEDAWKLVVDAYCDLTDAIPGGLPIA